MLSIFIPRISVNVDEQMIIDEFACTIGEVSRVDFCPIGKRPGFIEPDFHQDAFISAFVHFDLLYENYYNAADGNVVDIEGIVKFIENNDTPYRYYPYCVSGYWLLLKNKNLTPYTLMNNHQIVESGQLLELRVEDLEVHVEKLLNLQVKQKKTIKNLKKTIEDQRESIALVVDRMNSMEDVIYQLLGGLFNHTKQKGILQTHIDILLYKRYDENTTVNLSKWDNYPTTRQGDSNEERIEFLEKFLGVRSTNSEEGSQDEQDINDDTSSTFSTAI